MKVTRAAIPDVLVIEPEIFCDSRGSFMESFNQQRFAEAIGLDVHFVQDNHSVSVRGVLRGLHHQGQRPQGKLVRVTRGRVFDVAVDIRQESAFCGKWVGVELSETNNRQLWIPRGFAHGYLVMSDRADFLYKSTDYYFPEEERCIAWDDGDLAIDWPLRELEISSPLMSTKDQLGMPYLPWSYPQR